MSQPNRPLTENEYRLARWMLEHGSEKAREFLPQLESAEVTPWRCPCGCASINFHIKGSPTPVPPGIAPICDFLFGASENLSGIFLFSQQGVLSGLEVYGLAGDAPKVLPEPQALRPWENAAPAA